MQCSALAGTINPCLARWTGKSQITIQLIADYVLQIYEFLTNSVNFTSLLQFLQIVEKNIDPEVSVVELRCQCTKPDNTSALFPWDCTSTVEGEPSALAKCECLNKDENSAFCDIRVDCIPFRKAVGGRCNNNVQYTIGNFHFDDIAFGAPVAPIPIAPIPVRTQCNAQVSREENSVDIFASAFCKPN